MSELPDSWEFAGLLDVSELLRGVTYTKSDASDVPFDGSIPVLRANNIVDRNFDFSALVHVPARLVSDAQRITKGDVVVATSSGSISVVGKAAQAGNDMHAGFGAFCGLLRPSRNIEARYFGHFFSTEAYRNAISSMARGVNINNLKRDHFESLSLPLAPLNEQKRIADKLDAVLARVDACRERLDRVSAILKRFRQAVLAAATSGRLTEEWRGGREADWMPQKLGNIARFIDYRGKTPTKTENGIPLITAKNIRPGYVAMEPREYIADDTYKRWMTRGIPRVGDVLITTEAPLGNVAIVDWEYKFALAQRVICLQFQNKIIVGKFAAIALQAPTFQFTLNEQSTGTTVAGIKAARLKELEIVLPSIDEQHEIVRRVEALFAYIDRVEANHTATRTHVERLIPALLAKAFRGELIPQDPNDEPASVLLERIRTSRAAAGEKPPRKVATLRYLRPYVSVSGKRWQHGSHCASQSHKTRKRCSL